MKVSAYFTSVHIPSFGRAVTSNAADSKMEVSAYLTSVHIPSFRKGCDRHCCRQRNGSICLFHKCAYTVFGRAVTGKIEHSDASEEEVYSLLDLQVSTYSLLATFRQK